MHSRVTCADIAAFLSAREMLATPVVATPGLSTVVAGIARVEAARTGDLSWLAPRNAESLPTILASFNGSFLLCPSTADVLASDSAILAYCMRPKEAFAAVVQHFFPELTAIEWPQSPIAADALIGARVKLAPGVCIGQGVAIADDVSIGPNTCLVNTVVGSRTSIGANCTIGMPGFGYDKSLSGSYIRFPHIGRVLIGEDVEIGSNTCIDRGALDDTVICNGVKIDNLVHVAHNATIGAHSLIIAHAMIGGSVHIGDDTWVAPNVAVKNQLTVGAGAVLGMGAVVLRDVPAGVTMVGNPARELTR